jgi:membrane fusion protein (multidrug efflux system)
MNDNLNPASKQEVIELREEVRRLREEQQKLRQQRGNGQGSAEEKQQRGTDAGAAEKEEREEKSGGGGEEEAGGKKPESAFRRHRKPIILVAVVVLFLGGLIWWLYSRQFENTDDATVDGHISAIAARIASLVTGVYTDENAYVKTGQLLADLDPKDFQVAVEQAQGQLLQAQSQSRAELPNVPVTQVTNQTEIAVANSAVSAAEAGVAAAERNYEAALQKVRESDANNAKAQADVERYRPLAAKDEVPQEQFAQVQATAQSLAAAVSADQANARAVERQVQQAREQLSQAQTRAAETLENAPRQLAIRRANVASREAGMEAAQAALDQARLNLSYCN